MFCTCFFSWTLIRTRKCHYQLQCLGCELSCHSRMTCAFSSQALVFNSMWCTSFLFLVGLLAVSGMQVYFYQPDTIPEFGLAHCSTTNCCLLWFHVIPWWQCLFVFKLQMPAFIQFTLFKMLLLFVFKRILLGLAQCTL